MLLLDFWMQYEEKGKCARKRFTLYGDKEISVPETFPVVVKNSTIQYVDEVTETELETKPEPENPSSTTESTAASEGNSVSSETPTSSPSSNLDENEIS